MVGRAAAEPREAADEHGPSVAGLWAASSFHATVWKGAFRWSFPDSVGVRPTCKQDEVWEKAERGTQSRMGHAGLQSNIQDRRTEEQTQPPVECQMREERERDGKRHWKMEEEGAKGDGTKERRGDARHNSDSRWCCLPRRLLVTSLSPVVFVFPTPPSHSGLFAAATVSATLTTHTITITATAILITTTVS